MKHAKSLNKKFYNEETTRRKKKAAEVQTGPTPIADLGRVTEPPNLGVERRLTKTA